LPFHRHTRVVVAAPARPQGVAFLPPFSARLWGDGNHYFLTDADLFTLKQDAPRYGHDCPRQSVRRRGWRFLRWGFVFRPIGLRGNLYMSDFTSPPPAYLRLGKRRIPVPRRKAARIATGACFTFIGLFPPAPLHLLLPVGLSMLSLDFPRLRRLRRRAIVRIGRRWNRKPLAPLGAPA
jgi:hypothetical protein